jgi:hypothetical protein
VNKLHDVILIIRELKIELKKKLFWKCFCKFEYAFIYHRRRCNRFYV